MDRLGFGGRVLVGSTINEEDGSALVGQSYFTSLFGQSYFNSLVEFFCNWR